MRWTHMEQHEYIKIKLTDIPQKFIDEYELHDYAYNWCVYFEAIKGSHVLPQGGKLVTTSLVGA